MGRRRLPARRVLRRVRRTRLACVPRHAVRPVGPLAKGDRDARGGAATRGAPPREPRVDRGVGRVQRVPGGDGDAHRCVRDIRDDCGGERGRVARGVALVSRRGLEQRRAAARRAPNRPPPRHSEVALAHRDARPLPARQRLRRRQRGLAPRSLPAQLADQAAGRGAHRPGAPERVCLRVWRGRHVLLRVDGSDARAQALGPPRGHAQRQLQRRLRAAVRGGECDGGAQLPVRQHDRGLLWTRAGGLPRRHRRGGLPAAALPVPPRPGAQRQVQHRGAPREERARHPGVAAQRDLADGRLGSLGAAPAHLVPSPPATPPLLPLRLARVRHPGRGPGARRAVEAAALPVRALRLCGRGRGVRRGRRLLRQKRRAAPRRRPHRRPRAGVCQRCRDSLGGGRRRASRGRRCERPLRD
mmetsp:Transcript_33478/g.111698  ORF Transcript_33478/g.111698 Transcript_33478/m.111698 type:complete len:414 (+) Transcript_33478:1534-2775(+)